MLFEQILPEIKKQHWASLPNRQKIIVLGDRFINRFGTEVCLSAKEILSNEWYLMPRNPELHYLKLAKSYIDNTLHTTYLPLFTVPEMVDLARWLQDRIQEIEAHD